MKFLILFCLVLNSVIAQDLSETETPNMSTPTPVATSAPEKTQDEKEGDFINFNALKKIFKNDKLDKEVQKKVEVVQQIKEEKQEKEIQKYFYPIKEDFWGFITEYWLIQNVNELKWDFERPDYGIEESVSTLFRTHGIIEKKLKILIINSPNLTHLALPGMAEEPIFIISLPFMRTMDLTKQEIAVLLLEDFIRLEMNQLMNYISTKDLDNILGKNYQGKTMDMTYVKKCHDSLNDFLKNKGFTFQDQYDVTKKMDALLRGHLPHWNAYMTLLQKTDKLVKTNLMFENHIKLYPSPEMQMKWLNPKEKK